jgi:hypothetical protein
VAGGTRLRQMRPEELEGWGVYGSFIAGRMFTGIGNDGREIPRPVTLRANGEIVDLNPYGKNSHTLTRRAVALLFLEAKKRGIQPRLTEEQQGITCLNCGRPLQACHCQPRGTAPPPPPLRGAPVPPGIHRAP